MSVADPLRRTYLNAREGVRQAESDRSQLLTGLSQVETLFDRSRHGDSLGDVQDEVTAHVSLVETLEYEAEDLDAVDLLADEPTFADFGVESSRTLLAILEEIYADERDESFDALVTCLRDAVAGGGSSLESLFEHLDALVAAFDSRDSDRFHERAGLLVAGFEAEAVRTHDDFRELLEADRGPFYGEDLRALCEDDAYRKAAIAALAEAIESGDRESFVAARRPFARAARALDTLAERRRDELSSVTADLVDEYPDDHDQVHPRIDHRTPVLLTPTRLETQFVRRTDDDGEPVDDPPRHELLVRVYPDDLHVDTHERELTDAEVDGGVRFWEQVFWASHLDDERTALEAIPDRILAGVDLDDFPDDSERRHAAVKERAWNRLADRFGPERAAWIKRQLAPDESDLLLLEPDQVSFPDGGLDEIQTYVEAFLDDLDGRAESIERRPNSWTRPPRARLLPDQWVAFAEIDDDELTATSEPVSRPLSIGPDPGSVESAVDAADEYDVRSGEIDWVFDFDAAEEAGMALRVELTTEQRDHGVDRLVVLGVSTGPNEIDSAGDVANLVESHHYTDGVSLLEDGTPTNDTRDESAGTAQSDPDSIYERECTREPVTPADADADGALAARLLGIDPADLGDGRFVFGRVSGAGRSIDATAGATNAALWSATWGYVVPHLFVPLDWHTGTDTGTGMGIYQRERLIRWLEGFRRHFVEYVRASGPLPTIRVDSQPYGILPTTDFDRWEATETLSATPTTDVPATAGTFEYARYPDRDVSATLEELLTALRDHWTDALANVPHVDSADDPERVTADLLSMAATSVGYRLREFTGGRAMAELVGTAAVDPALETAHAATRTQLDEAVDHDHVPALGDLMAAEEAPVVDAPLVRDSLAPTLQTLLTTRHDGLRTGLPGTDVPGPGADDWHTWLVTLFLGGETRSVAEVLCYHALLQEYRLARVRLGAHYEHWDAHLERGMVSWDDTPWSLIPERQVYDDGHLTMWDALEHDVPDQLRNHPEYRAEWSIGDMLREVPAIDRPYAELTQAFQDLENADLSTVERHVRETLDLASHRYDAWATSLATRRLSGIRDGDGRGLTVGAYGYVEDLRPSDGERSSGYVQAPSIDQATTAAVMRSAHDAETDEYGDLFAVDLSADRVRDARELLDGVRAGYSLGELLGYRFERALHENDEHDLDKYVYPFRALAPLVEGSIDREEAEASDAVAERDVVDGVALYELWRSEDDDSNGDQSERIPWGQAAGSEGIELPHPDSESDVHGAIVDELEAIEGAHDAVQDVLAAEGVYQLVRDNPERAGAALDALARGEAVADLEVVDTPRTATSCTHRIAALLEDGADESPWPDTAMPRASAEPALEDWVGTLLGDPTRVVCRVAFRPDPDDGRAGGETTDDGQSAESDDSNWRITTVYLSELRLSALDVVSLVEGDEAAWASELEARIGYYLQRVHEDVGPSHEIRLSFARPAEWPDAPALNVDPDTAVGFGELLEVARGIRAVVNDGRSVDARDLAVPGEATDDGQVVGDLDERAADAYGRLEAAVDALDPHLSALAADDDTDQRAVDELIALVDGLADLPADELADAGATLESLDETALHDELDALGDAVTGSGPLVATDATGDVVLSAEQPRVEGLVAGDETVTVSLDGGTLSEDVTADADGHFHAAFDPDAFDAIEEFTVAVEHETGVTSQRDGRFASERPPHSLALPTLESVAGVTSVLDDVAADAERILAARDALADDVIDASIARLDDDVWPSEAAVDLAVVRDLDGITIPGFDAPSFWETLSLVASALGEDELSAGDVEAAALGSDTPSVSELDALCRDISNGIDELADGIDAAENRPDVIWIAGALEILRESLLECSGFGIYGSVPLSAEGATPEAVETLASQAGSVRDEARDRLDEFDTRPADDDAPEDDPAFYVDWLEALFGDGITVLVPFEPTNPGEVVDALDTAHSEALQGGNRLAVETWFDRIARVREESRAFGRLLTYGEALGERSPADGPRFDVGQFPYDEADTWVGLPDAWEDEHPTGRLSIVSHRHGSPGALGENGTGGENADEPQSYVGLFVDELVETVPSDSETTGLSVQYDRPATQAPNTVLLAVPPVDDADEVWSLAGLADVVRESVDLAKLRTVDREAIDGLGQLLPGLTVPTNESADPAGPDTASVDREDLLARWSAFVDDGGEN